MASTALGGQLTQAYRAQQLAVQARSLTGLLQLWQAVDLEDLSGTVEVFAQAAGLLAAQGSAQSAAGAALYYPLFRRAELGAAVAVRSIEPSPAAAMASEIRGAALSGIINGRRAGMSLPRASRNGLVKAAGTLGKLVLGGGRMTILRAVQDDRKAQGWLRATSGSPCAFCRMLSSRGAVYKTKRGADFQPHDHCGCTPEPFYGLDDKPSADRVVRSEEFAAQWSQAQAWARDNITRDKSTENNALNNFRRWLNAGEPTAGNAGTEDSGHG